VVFFLWGKPAEKTAKVVNIDEVSRIAQIRCPFAN
jgi:hypothetical protein